MNLSTAKVAAGVEATTHNASLRDTRFLGLGLRV